MRTKQLLFSWMAATCLLLSVINLSAQVPAHGSLIGIDAPVWTQTLPIPVAGPLDPPLESVQTNTTLNYKVVTMNGKTWVWMQLSAGFFWGDISSEFGYTLNEGATATKFPVPAANRIAGTNEREIIGSTTTAIPAGVQLFMRPQANLGGAAGGINGDHHTVPVNYDPAAYNSSTGETIAPVFPAGGPGKTVTSSSITITLNATDNSGNLFYYIENAADGITDVIFTNSVTYTYPVTQPNHTYTVYAVDFSGNASAPQTVSTVNTSATQLPAPTGLTVSADKKSVSFNPVANATGYYLAVFDGDNLIYEMPAYTSGDALRYLLAGNFSIKVKALGDGDIYSNSEFAEVAWNVAGSDIDLSPNAKYCNWLFNPPAGNNCIAGDEDAAYLTWATDAQGDITISIAPNFLLEGVTNQTEFRGSGINTPENITVNGDPNTNNKYFTVSLVREDNLNKKVKLAKKAGVVIPVGSQIAYANGFLVYKTVVDAATNTALALGGNLHDLYPNTPYTADVPYIYGSSCSTAVTGLTTPAAAKELLKNQYYTIDGRQVSSPTSGLYIVKKIYKDNSVKTEKVFIK